MNLIVIGVIVGVAGGVLVVICAIIVVRFLLQRRQSIERSTSDLPIRMNGVNTSTDSSVSISGSNGVISQQEYKRQNYQGRGVKQEKDSYLTISGIPRYMYKELQKATDNFTTILGQGSFGPVCRATLPDGSIVAVKVLASNSTQGEREFRTEVELLSRLHHRNLVNLVGYCVEKGQRILVYEYMSNGSLASHLYGENKDTLTWDQRLQIALDISHGIEYLHEGAVPPVIHRDLKSANILLDNTMKAKVADFGLSKEDVYDGGQSTLKGTYGYMDPDYVSSNRFTKKSDVYSFGIILFELITAINPQQGLMEYVNLATIGGDANVGWDEIIDKNIVNRSNPQEVRDLADLAYRCVNKNPRSRPSISDVTQEILKIKSRCQSTEDIRLVSRNDTSGTLRRIEMQQYELSGLASTREQAMKSKPGIQHFWQL